MENKNIVPTERGMQLAQFLDRTFSNVINLNYTKEMEKDLDKIASGKKKKSVFLKEFYDTLEDTISKNTEVGSPDGEAKICPKCGATMILRRSRFGRLFWGCSKYPKCNGIVNID